MQCRCSVGSERAPASHACLARARSRIGKRGPLPLSLSRRLASPVCIHLSLSLSLPLSLYPYLLSISLACMYMCVYPLLRGSFSRRINLYVYKQPSAFRVRVRNALLPPTCVVTFGRSLARSQASPRAPLSVCMHTHIQRVRGGNGTTLDRSVSLVVLNAAQLPREAFSLLRLFLFRLREFRVKLVFAYEKSVIKILLLFRISEG